MWIKNNKPITGLKGSPRLLFLCLYQSFHLFILSSPSGFWGNYSYIAPPFHFCILNEQIIVKTLLPPVVLILLLGCHGNHLSSSRLGMDRKRSPSALSNKKTKKVTRSQPRRVHTSSLFTRPMGGKPKITSNNFKKLQWDQFSLTQNVWKKISRDERKQFFYGIKGIRIQKICVDYQYGKTVYFLMYNPNLRPEKNQKGEFHFFEKALGSSVIQDNRGCYFTKKRCVRCFVPNEVLKSIKH